MDWDDEYDDEDDGYFDDEEDDYFDDEEQEEVDPAQQSLEEINERLNQIEQEQAENDMSYQEYNNQIHTDVNEQDEKTDAYLQKKEELDNEKQKLEEEKNKRESNAIVARGGKKKKKEIKAKAKELHCLEGDFSDQCPHCKQQIYSEPVWTALWKTAAMAIIGVKRPLKFVCLNKSCKHYYQRTGDTFTKAGNQMTPKKNIFWRAKE